MEPLISVIVPVYNVQEYLPECLESLNDQSLEALEIILVNDGSTDNSGAVAKDYAERYPNRFFYYERENGGQSRARNFGLSVARGEFIAFVDSDDSVAPDIYPRMYNLAREQGADLVLCGFDRITVKGSGGTENTIVQKQRFSDMQRSGQTIYDCPQLLLEGSGFVWNKLFHSKLFDGIRFPEKKVYEDIAVIYTLEEKAGKIALLNEAGYYYRVRRSGASTTDPKTLYQVFDAVEQNNRYFKEKGVFDRFSDELAYLTMTHMLRARMFQIRKMPFLPRIRYISDAFRYMNKTFPGWKKNKYIYLKRTLQTPRYQADTLCFYTTRFLFLLRCQIKIGQGNALGDPGQSEKKDIFQQDWIEPRKELVMMVQRIHDLCTGRQLRYYAMKETLLGACRKHGFTPDGKTVNLAMPRDDYEKLIEIWEQSPGAENMILSAPEKDAHDNRPYARLIWNGERAPGENGGGKTCPGGLLVNIYPLDRAEKCVSRKDIRYLRKIHCVREMMEYKAGRMKGKRIIRKIRAAECVILGVSFRTFPSLQKKLFTLCTKYNKQETDYFSNYCGSYVRRFETFPAEWWGEPKPVRFGEGSIMIPEKPELFLSRYYDAV